MAYPTVSAPYGFQPINRIGGNPYAGSTRLVPVDSGAVYDGDLVEMLSSGKCAVVSSGTAASKHSAFASACNTPTPAVKPFKRSMLPHPA